MFKSLFAKLIGYGALISLISIGIFNHLNVKSITNTMLANHGETLRAIRNSRSYEIEEYFRVSKEQISHLAQNDMIINATREFSYAFDSLNEEIGKPLSKDSSIDQALKTYYTTQYKPLLTGQGHSWAGDDAYLPNSDEGRLLQWMYLVENPYMIGEKDLLKRSELPYSYNSVHARYHPRLNNFHSSFGYYDIFLFDLKGNLIYSVFKETDYATNFLHGLYRKTNLGKVYQQSLRSDSPGIVHIQDFEPYLPSYNQPAIFLSTPVYDGDKKIGVAAFQMSTTKINSIMRNSYGLGQTGKTFLIANDLTLRSTGYDVNSSDMLSTEIKTQATQLLKGGESDTLETNDPSRVAVLSSFAPLSIEGLGWGLVAEVHMDEVMVAPKQLSKNIATHGILTAVLFLLLMLFAFRRLIRNPVEALLKGAQSIQSGEYSTRVSIDTQDEFAALAQGFNSMAQSIEDDIKAIEEAAQKIQTLQSMLPICSSCKSIRDDEGYWKNIEEYLNEFADVQLTHSLCRPCFQELYGEEFCNKTEDL